MSEPLELQQIICPSCRNVISGLSLYDDRIECDYCHNVGYNPLITRRQMEMPERMIPFHTDQAYFEKCLIYHLIWQTHVPKDIFDQFSSDNVTKALVPMYLYEGNYEASWSCKVGVERNEVHASFDGQGQTNKTVTRFEPHSGTSRGNFAFLCLAHEGEDIPDKLREFCSLFEYKATASTEYVPNREDKELRIFAADTDRDLPWKRYGESNINKIATAQAADQLSNENFKDLRVSSSYELKHTGRLVMIPFWFIYYNYKDNRNYFLMDGLGDKRAMTTPQDQEEIAQIDNLRNMITAVGFLPWILILFIGYLLDDTAAEWVPMTLVFIWFGIFVWFYLRSNKQIDDILKASLAARKESALRMGVLTPEELDEYERRAGEKGEGSVQPSPRSRKIYAILAVLLGFLGVHNFYVKRYLVGGIQLAITLLSTGSLAFISFIWGIVEIFTCTKDGDERPLS